LTFQDPSNGNKRGEDSCSVLMLHSKYKDLKLCEYGFLSKTDLKGVSHLFAASAVAKRS
jgi:hypothetical protein